MTEEQPIDPTGPTPDAAPAGEPTADGPTAGGPAPEAAPSSRAREWLGQLETMIQNVAHEAAPTAREVGAKAAELAAAAAVKAGPLAHKAADATTEYGQRFAEKAQSVAADWRHENETVKAPEADEAPEAPDAPKEPPDEASI